MRLRLAAALLFLGAGAVHAGWTRPFRAEASAAADEYRRVRDERQQAVADQARAARLAAAPARVGSVPGTAADAPAARAARRLVVETLASSRVATVTLRVTPSGRAPAQATVHLKGAGSLDDVARLTAELARPGNGIVLSNVVLTPREGQVQLAFEALALGAP
ncbi:MAG: hypothetical protein ABW221_21170 [Vicinamibacteria bacterium]